MATYDNLKAASVALNIPWRKLKMAKGMGCPAFKSGRLNSTQYEDWLLLGTNKNTLESAYNTKFPSGKGNVGNDGENDESTEELKRQKIAKELTLLDLEIKKKSGEFLSPDDVKDFLVRLRLAFESTIKGWSGILPPKLIGLSQAELEAAIKQETSSLLNTFKDEIKKQINICNQKSKIT